MGKGSENTLLLEGSETTQQEPISSVKHASPNETLYSWKEVEKHSSKTDCWVVINDYVYNLTNFKRTHPGGTKLIDHFAGQDATVSYTLFNFSYLQ
jgi:cytochrome b involved in lipid metabolism